MKFKTFFKKILVPISLLVYLFLGMSIPGCKDKKKGSELEASSANCLSLSNSQLDDWFPTYSNPTDPIANRISVLKFYPVLNAGDSSYQMTVKAFNSADAQLGSELTLNTGTCSMPSPLPPLGQNYEVNLSDLTILKSDGSLKDNLTELILTPALYSGANLIQFNIAANINGTVQALYSGVPCPPCPNCRPPCPDNCVPACDSATMQVDTLRGTKDTMSAKKQ